MFIKQTNYFLSEIISYLKFLLKYYLKSKTDLFCAIEFNKKPEIKYISLWTNIYLVNFFKCQIFNDLFCYTFELKLLILNIF